MPASTLSNTNISATSQPIAIRFYLKHHGGVERLHQVLGQVGLELWFPCQQIAPIDLEWEKHKKKIIFSKTTRPRAFNILCAAMYSGPLYKSCQLCPWGPYRPRPGGIIGKTLKNLLRNHKDHSFNILYVAMYSGRLFKSSSCQPCPWGQKWACLGVH